MRRRGNASIVANPVLVGAVTQLVVIVAVFLSYNANKGLPFVPTTQMKFQVVSGANLLPGNDVREGGYRVGIVDDMRPIRLPNGESGAEVTIKIDKKSAGLPRDSKIILRPRSVLGLKYVEISRGKSDEIVPDGGTIFATQVSYPVELDDFYNIFDAPTRRAAQGNLQVFGDTFNQRGVSLNETIENAPAFLRTLEPVAKLLADDDTQLDRFFKELGDAARVVSPIAKTYSNSFDVMARTFEAWSRDPEALKDTISESVPTLRVGTRSFRVQRPFLRDFRDFSRSLAAAAATLPRTLPRFIPALEAGIPVLRRSGEMNKALGETFTALDELMRDPATGIAIRSLGRTVGILNPALRFIGPYVTVCNYFNYAWTNAGEHLSEPDPTGKSQRTLLNQAPRTRDPRDPSIGSLGAREPVNGEPVTSGSAMNLHTNVYSAAINADGTADCESGQRGYLERINRFGDKKYKTVIDPHIPGSQGTTFTGRLRVPEGQTFTRAPQSGPQAIPELDNP